MRKSGVGICKCVEGREIKIAKCGTEDGGGANGTLRLSENITSCLCRPLVDPCHLREVPLTVVVGREGYFDVE